MKINLTPLVGGVTVGLLMFSPLAFGQAADQQTTTTTVQQTTTKAAATHRPVRIRHRAEHRLRPLHKPWIARR